jgi:NAD(P)-dependent dehydrogenase (short-subunit alcohol dehydrogenase family)
MLKGKTALVTGSTSGIGLGDASQIGKLKKDLMEKNGISVAHDAADMTKPAEIAAMLARAIAQFGAPCWCCRREYGVRESYVSDGSSGLHRRRGERQHQ